MMFLVEVTAATRAEDVAIEFDSLIGATIWISQNAFSGDGYRIFGYEPASGELRPGSKAVLRVRAGDTEYASLVAALAAAPTDESQPYEILDLEQPIGSAPTLIVRRRISRVQADYDTEGGYTAGGSIVASRQNEWGRIDADRF